MQKERTQTAIRAPQKAQEAKLIHAAGIICIQDTKSRSYSYEKISSETQVPLGCYLFHKDIINICYKSRVLFLRTVDIEV